MKTTKKYNAAAKRSNQPRLAAIDGVIERASKKGYFSVTQFVETHILPQVEEHFKGRGLNITVIERDKQFRVTVSWE